LLEADIPSIVPVAVDDKGAPIVDVLVTVDGTELTSRLDGRASSVDPGLHAFSFSAPGKTSRTEEVAILQGQRNRVISVVLEDERGTDSSEAAAGNATRELIPTAEAPAPEVAQAVPAPEAPHSGGRSKLPYILGGAGLAVLGAGAVMTYWGRQDNAALAGCKPACNPDSVDHIRKLYLGADIALGVGVAAIGVACWAFFAGSSDEPPDPNIRIEMHPTPSGAAASFGGAF
jgi:hypothetical protein